MSKAIHTFWCEICNKRMDESRPYRDKNNPLITYILHTCSICGVKVRERRVKIESRW